jgi:hypothetical protein
MIQSSARLRCQVIWLVFTFGILAGSAFAGNYDGSIYVELSCKKHDGGHYGNSFPADVVDGKFAGRRDFKKGDSGCRNKACWTAWEGTIRGDGGFNMIVQENDWLRPSSGYVGRWTLSGKFTTPDAGTAKAVKFPRDWLAKCDLSPITLVDAAPDSLAARGVSTPAAQIEKIEPAVQKDFKPILRDAKLLLRKVEAYAKSSTDIPKIISIAQAASKLKSAIKASEARSSHQGLGEQVEKLSGDLAQMLAQDANYAGFARKWDEAKRQSDAQSAIKLKVKATVLHDFLIRYVTQNVTSDANENLFPQIRALEELGPNPSFDQLETAVAAAEAAINSAGLASEYDGAAPSNAAVAEAAVEPQPSTLSIAVDPASQPQKRVALVIGNSAYRNAVELLNPRNDAIAVSAKLLDLGFEVVDGQDLDKNGMERSIREFIRKVEGADVSFFFYAGHGMQVAGKNYLIPVDARLEDTAAIDFETIDADRVLGYMAEENRVAIALLDACRDNPLSRKFALAIGASRSTAVGRGLAVPSTLGGGMLIGFATAPGEVALDGQGPNSPFTTALLKYIPQKGLEIQQLMTKVKAEVYQSTNKKQSPWHNSDLRQEFYLQP